MRFYNHYDLHEFGEIMELADQPREDSSSPNHRPEVEQVSTTTYHIVVDLPYFSNPIFEINFRKAYRVQYAKAHSPFQLLIHLKQPSYFPLEIRNDLQLVFSETLEMMIDKKSFNVPIVPIQMNLSKAS